MVMVDFKEGSAGEPQEGNVGNKVAGQDKDSAQPMDHDAHMEDMKSGLQQILASNDINEIKQIAQGLLGEEKSEMSAEKSSGLEAGIDKILAK